MLLHSKGLETSRKLTLVGGLTLPGVFRRKKVNLPTQVTLAALLTQGREKEEIISNVRVPG